MTDEEIYEELLPMVSQISIALKRSFGYSTREDIAQYCWLFVFTRPRKVREYLENEEKGKLYVSVKNFARKECLKEKADLEGWHWSDLSWYTYGSLESLLDIIFDDEDWTSPPGPQWSDTPKGGGDPASGNNYLATLADVSRALDSLRKGHRDIIQAIHRDGMTQGEIAKVQDVSQSTAGRRYRRAVAALLDALGGPYPEYDEPDKQYKQYTGQRRTMSNAAAMATIGADWDE